MYKCNNNKCIKCGEVTNPGGRIVIRDGKSHFTGSKCKECGEEMEHITNQMPTIHNIKNDSDGRNL